MCLKTSAGCSPDKNSFGHGWFSSSSRLRRHHHALLFLPPFTDDGNSVTRLGREHNDQVLTDPDLIAHLVVSHIARQSSAASTLGLSSHWWSRQCVVCTPQSPLYASRASRAWCYACCIAYSRACRLLTNCYGIRSSNRFSNRVDFNESFVSSDVTTCSEVTSAMAHSKTPLHRREAPVFCSVVFISAAIRSVVVLHVSTVLHSFAS